MSRNILLTGGCGYLGSNFAKYWVKNYPEDRLVIVDKLTYAGRLSNISSSTYRRPLAEYYHSYSYDDIPTVAVYNGDISDPRYLRYVLENNGKFDLIINMAAETHVDNSLKDSSPFMQSNFMGTHSLLERAKAFNLPVIHISTDEVLDHHYPIKQIEDGILAPRNPYSASKAAAEMLCQAYRANFNMDITVVRPTNLFGPSNQHNEKFLPKAITNLLSGKKVPLYGEGIEMRNWLFMEDACKALELIINLPVRQHIYHIAPDNEISNKDLLKKVLDRLDISWEDGVELVENRLGHDPWYGMSSARIRSLGWAPTSLDEGLDITLQYYRNKLSG